MTTVIVWFLTSATIIVIAGSMLTTFADAIAELTGLGRLIVGSVLLAAGTSLPELTVDIAAVRLGAVDLAAGDLLGSCLMNLFILALLDLTSRSRGKMLSRQSAAHALSGSVSIVMTAVVAFGLLTGPPFARYAVMGISLVAPLVLLTYLLGVRLVYLDQRIAVREFAEKEPDHAAPTTRLTLPTAIGGFAVCAIVILLVGPSMARSAEQLAEMTGLGDTFVGTTLVALCTSLPEFVSMLAALRIGALDLAIGNAFGSNAFNMVLFLPLDLATSEPLFSVVSMRHAITAIGAIIATQIVILGQLYQAERRIRGIEPDATLVIFIVVAVLATIHLIP
ncbi:MAG: sodium:calcium antiporter [Planctomycetales bacterium]|nr:sodium:calcium antiporter [Planctomycetales bacterium]